MKFRLIAVLIICGIGLTLFGGRGLIVMVTPAVNLYDDNCNWEKLHSNQKVQTNLDFVLDNFYAFEDDASELYMLPDLRFYDDGAQIEHYMAVVVPSSRYAEFDALVEDSWSWWDGDSKDLAVNGTIPMDGYLRKMKKGEKEELVKTLQYYGYTDERIEEVIIPYVLMKSQTPIANILSFFGGILMFLAGAAVALFSFIKKN